MQPQHLQTDFKRYLWIGILCAIIFVLIQIVPATSDSFFGSSTAAPISKSSAGLKGASFAKEQFGENVNSIHVVYQSDSLLYGYLSKKDLLDQYSKTFDEHFPTETYQVEAKLASGNTAYVYVHMTKGTIVAWNLVSKEPNSAALTGNKLLKAAHTAAAQHGINEKSLLNEPSNREQADEQVLKVTDSRIGDSMLELHTRAYEQASGIVVITEYKPVFKVPASYEQYVKEQDQLGSRLSLLGNLLPSGIMLILSIIYAARYRKHTSFNRGWLLSLIFLGFYIINIINMMDGIRASVGETPDAALNTAIGTFFTFGITAMFAAATYFSLVGGDGLWRQMRRNLWLQASEPGYGSTVWNSMRIAYVLAFILLGLQTIVLLILQQAIGSWSTTDVTQSVYNLTSPLLLPLLAWCAAIQEEAVFRMFGIALFRKWFKNPFIAALIPTVIWALGHVTYPIYPATTRLIEVTILGLLFCFIFLRYGFITAVFTHAIFDSVLMASSLLVDGNTVSILIGIGYIIAPIGVAWLLRLLNRVPQRL